MHYRKEDSIEMGKLSTTWLWWTSTGNIGKHIIHMTPLPSLLTISKRLEVSHQLRSGCPQTSTHEGTINMVLAPILPYTCRLFGHSQINYHLAVLPWKSNMNHVKSMIINHSTRFDAIDLILQTSHLLICQVFSLYLRPCLVFHFSRTSLPSTAEGATAINFSLSLFLSLPDNLWISTLTNE